MGRDLGQLVAARRHELGLSRKELAEQAGLSYPYLSQIETGDREPALRTMHLLANALQIPVEQLAGMTSPGVWVSGPPLSPSLPPLSEPQRLMSTESALEMWRDKVMAPVERRLRPIPPAIRIALLNELLSQAVGELMDEHSDSHRN